MRLQCFALWFSVGLGLGAVLVGPNALAQAKDLSKQSTTPTTSEAKSAKGKAAQGAPLRVKLTLDLKFIAQSSNMPAAAPNEAAILKAATETLTKLGYVLVNSAEEASSGLEVLVMVATSGMTQPRQACSLSGWIWVGGLVEAKSPLPLFRHKNRFWFSETSYPMVANGPSACDAEQLHKMIDDGVRKSIVSVFEP